MVRYLHPADHHPARITKAHRDFARKLNFEVTKFPVKIRDIYTIEKSIVLPLVFLVMKVRKNIQSIKKLKNVVKNHIDLLLIEEEAKRHYVLIKDSNTLRYDHTLHHKRKHFCRYCLQVFSAEEILKLHIKDCFKVCGK